MYRIKLKGNSGASQDVLSIFTGGAASLENSQCVQDVLRNSHVEPAQNFHMYSSHGVKRSAKILVRQRKLDSTGQYRAALLESGPAREYS
eukprot:g66037.t1